MANTKKETDSKVKPAVKKNTGVKTAVVKEDTVTTVKATKKFASDDMIPCQSLRFGTLLHISKKTGNAYEWSNYGDIVEVAYTDLLAMKSAKSKFIYSPWILIQDEDAIEALKLTETYQTFEDYEDVDEFFNQTPSEIRAKLSIAPVGFRDLIAYIAASMIRNGSLDSIAIIKAIDDTLHKNLSSLIGGN